MYKINIPASFEHFLCCICEKQIWIKICPYSYICVIEAIWSLLIYMFISVTMNYKFSKCVSNIII